MEIKEFAGKVRRSVEKELGKGYRTEIREVRKNNGVMLHGLLIMSEGNNVAPTIYLDSFWEIYESGTSFAVIIRRLLAIYRENTPGGKVDMEFFRSFGKVKDRICYRLIGRKGNEELLKDIPYIEFLDMALCFYYAYQGDRLGNGAILIHNSHIDMWGTCTAEVLKLAQANTPELFPWVCNSMGDVLREIAGWDIPGESLCGNGALEEIPMKVLGNVQRLHGAVCMLYPGVLEGLARREQRNFYILPSSIHEVVLLADTGMANAEELKDMIFEVNSTQVSPEEVLSDSLYYYDLTEKRIKKIF